MLADESGRVDVKYKPDAAAKIYRASTANLKVTPELENDRPAELPEGERAAGAGEAKAKRPTARGAGAGAAKALPPHVDPPALPGDGVPGHPPVQVWTDGACTGNPGPMGIGVVVVADGQRQELSEYLGVGTNNIAELTAIERGLEVVESLGAAWRERAVQVYSDSAYAIGLLSQNWKAKANAELVARLRSRVARFPRIRFVKVAGHAGVPDNERCDELARGAVVRRR